MGNGGEIGERVREDPSTLAYSPLYPRTIKPRLRIEVSEGEGERERERERERDVEKQTTTTTTTTTTTNQSINVIIDAI